MVREIEQVSRRLRIYEWWKWERRRWCWHCWRLTTHWEDEGCGHLICARHADWETEYGDFGSVISTYPMCTARKCDVYD